MQSQEQAALNPSIATSDAIAERSMVFILAVTCGLAVGNVYFNQPLLADMGRSFEIPVQAVGFIPTSTQVGYAIGLLLLAPLGDRLERRRLIVSMMALVTLALIAVALSPNVVWLCIASFALGFTTMVSHLIIPLVAQVTAPSKRGRVIGILVSGVILSLLLARAVSGIVGHQLGWRSMYWIAAALMAGATIVIWKRLPLCPPVSKLSYRQLMQSVIQLIHEQPVLREAALVNALVFASFNVFWSTLIFFLESPSYHYDSQAAGLFGLLGVTGAIAAPIVGRLIDRYGAKTLVSGALVLALFAFTLMGAAGTTLVGLILGVVVLDLGMQSAYLSNQIRVYSLVANAESRLNTVYMVTSYSGGAIGSCLGAYSWGMWQWHGVCGLGLGLLILAAIVHFYRRPRSPIAAGASHET